MRLATLKKLLARTTIKDELALHRTDCLASHGNLDNYLFVKERLAAFDGVPMRPAPLVRGQDLVRLGLEPGPLFGTILRELYDLQLDEQVKTKGAAIAYVKKRWAVGKRRGRRRLPVGIPSTIL
jgi:hypothetical protein